MYRAAVSTRAVERTLKAAALLAVLLGLAELSAACTASCRPGTVRQGSLCVEFKPPNAADAAAISGGRAQTCGNGVFDEGESCEADDAAHPCPTAADCDDGDACTQDEVRGSAEACDARCVSRPIRAQVSGDGCCITEPDASADADCLPKCGNGKKEMGEVCDGACPTRCPVSAGCQQQMLRGSAEGCDAECVEVTITAPQDGDGCCPDGANATIDGDCTGCRTAEDCAFAERCNAGTCECPGMPSATNPEHCGRCGNACDESEECDNGKCEPLCGNGRIDDGEVCDESAAGWTNSSGACVRCKLTAEVYQACRGGGLDCWPGSSAVGWLCSGGGACSRVCETNTDCQAEGVTGTCVTAAVDFKICALQNCNECRNGTRCQWYGDEGESLSTAIQLCGWVSLNRSNQPWCPHEYQRCCSPWGTCVEHPCVSGDEMMWPQGCNF
jgi:hypothetical protein